MYHINLHDRETLKSYCELSSKAKVSKKILRISDFVWGELNDGKWPIRGRHVSEKVISDNPCCFLCALIELEENFQKICKKKYGIGVDMVDFDIDGIKLLVNSDQMIEIELDKSSH